MGLSRVRVRVTVRVRVRVRVRARVRVRVSTHPATDLRTLALEPILEQEIQGDVGRSREM